MICFLKAFLNCKLADIFSIVIANYYGKNLQKSVEIN